MFNEVHIFLLNSKQQFRDNVQDEFGQSILNDIYEPVLDEVAVLIRMEEESETQLGHIKKLLEEARSIKGDDYGY